MGVNSVQGIDLLDGIGEGGRSGKVSGDPQEGNGSVNCPFCYDCGGFPGDTLDRVRKYGVNAQELVTTSSTRLLVAT